MEKAVYRISEFCLLYAISRTSLYREIRSTRLRVIKRGRRVLISRTEAERWFIALCQKNEPQPSV